MLTKTHDANGVTSSRPKWVNPLNSCLKTMTMLSDLVLTRWPETCDMKRDDEGPTRACGRPMHVCDRRPSQGRDSIASAEVTPWDALSADVSHSSNVAWAPGRLKSPTTRLFAQEPVEANSQEEIMKMLHYWSFVGGIHCWRMASPHNRPIIRKAFSCHSVFMLSSFIQKMSRWAGRFRVAINLRQLSCFASSVGNTPLWHRKLKCPLQFRFVLYTGNNYLTHRGILLNNKSKVVNPGTTDFASRPGTNGFAKQ